ncbi:uncharacterized protein BP5553_08091 [Venustampulla echinocandica]|uniref:Uncharacterized protein n=1 Tax=Venustampulla echinocandica TaxID=2656787 RepID=A0A370TFQ0_9HELO|nr:uncharacterized protein BP5553_08091 [Venustampulla echinocandica]RDL33723.1 hypothetical protein BP5553_08091 [Venustampulla echinocandica]
MEHSDALRDVPSAEDKATDLEAPATIAPTVDLDDDQRGPNDLFDIEYTAGATTGSATQPSCSIAFRVPEKQRATMVIRIKLPRDMSLENNPKNLDNHCVSIYLPASQICSFDYEDLPDGYTLSTTDGFSLGDGFVDHSGGPCKFGRLCVQSLGAFIQGGEVPKLADSAVEDAIKKLIKDLRHHTREAAQAQAQAGQVQQLLPFMFLINRSDDLTHKKANTFSARISAELLADPSMAWLQNTANGKCFTMDTLVDFAARPKIPLQRAETVFVDSMSILIPTVYQAVFEEDFVQQTMTELKIDTFNAHFIESPLAVNKADNNTDITVGSLASAYICFVDFTDKIVVRPEIGDMVRVHIIQEKHTPDTPGFASEPNNTVIEPANNTPEPGSDSELGDEAIVDVFDYDELDDDNDPNA